MTTNQIDTANENEAEVPGQHEDHEELTEEITDNLKEGRKHFSEWRTFAREDYDFFAGIQWSEEDRQILEEENRPVVTFNRIARTINAVTGLELQNRQEVRFLPRRTTQQPAPAQPGQPQQPQTSDAGYGEMLTSAAKWVRDGCDAEDEESEAFQDCLVCGLGFTETRMDYEVEQEGKIIIERVDPLEMVVDPEAKKRNFDDARWIARVKQLTKKEVKELWPDNVEISNGTFWNDSESTPHDAQDAWRYENDQADRMQKANYVSVIQYQYWKRVTMFKVATPEGTMVDLPAERFKAIQPMIESSGMKSARYTKRVYRQCFLIGNKIVESADMDCDHFTFRAITGLRDRNKNQWFGLVTLMKDPQRWANKWLSQIQHIVNSNAKGGVMLEEGATNNINKFEESWAKPNAVIRLNQGGLAKIQQREAPQFPVGVDKLLQYAIQSINDVPGVNLELIGMAERDQPYVLEQSRKQAGITILASFFDALRRYRKVQGRVLANYIRSFISDGRLIRVLGPEGANYVPLIKDAVSFDYDIVVDDSPTSPNSKERTFNGLMQIVPLAMQAGIPIPPDILDFAPLPENLVQKWKQMIAGKQNDPLTKQLEQIKMMLSQLEVEQKQADLQKTSSEVTKNYAQAEQFHAVGQDETAQANQKMGMDSQAHDMKMEQMQKEQARKDLELMLNNRRKEIESQMNMQIKAQQANQQNYH